MNTQVQLLRRKNGLPETALILREQESIAHTPGFEVLVFGYSHPTYWQACECCEYKPCEFMRGQINQWLIMIGRAERV